MEKNLSKKVLEKIKKEQIKPAPRWEFLLKKSVLWGILIVALLIGGVATGVVIFMLKSQDWDLHKYLDSSFLRFLLESLPYFWLLVLGVFILVVLYNFKHTEHGYRYRSSTVMGIGIGVTVLLGLAFFGTGMSQAVENSILQKFPTYQKISHDRMMDRWKHPERGLLAGEVTEFLNGDKLMLVDFNGEEWTIIVKRVPRDQKRYLQVGIVVKAFGERVGEGEFDAVELRPWERNVLQRPRVKQEIRVNIQRFWR